MKITQRILYRICNKDVSTRGKKRKMEMKFMKMKSKRKIEFKSIQRIKKISVEAGEERRI